MASICGKSGFIDSFICWTFNELLGSMQFVLYGGGAKKIAIQYTAMKMYVIPAWQPPGQWRAWITHPVNCGICIQKNILDFAIAI
jgi:hypothetical protein